MFGQNPKTFFDVLSFMKILKSSAHYPITAYFLCCVWSTMTLPCTPFIRKSTSALQCHNVWNLNVKIVFHTIFTNFCSKNIVSICERYTLHANHNQDETLSSFVKRITITKKLVSCLNAGKSREFCTTAYITITSFTEHHSIRSLSIG